MNYSESQVNDRTQAKRKPEHPATFLQKLALSLFLLVLTIVAISFIYYTIQQINIDALAETSTPWQLPNGFVLRDAPASFHYDPAQKRLIHRGPITSEKKLQLRDLLELQSALPRDNSAGQAEVNPTEAQSSAAGSVSSADAPKKTTGESEADLDETRKAYNSALDELQYLSTTRQGSTVQLLLLLGLFGGVLGAVLRSLVDFVGNACYTQALDLVLWWPLYLTRPVVGGILGFVLVVLFKAKLLTATDISLGDDSFSWLGISVIGGFSTVDVTLRLRLAAKALFGVESGEKK